MEQQQQTLNMEPSSPTAFQSQPDAETLSVLLARAAIFIFLFGLVCLLLNIDRNTLGTVLIGVTLVFVILSLKKIIKGNWRRKRMRRGSTVRLCVPSHQWRRIFRGELPIPNSDQPQQNTFTPLDDIMQLSQGLYQPVTPVPALLPPSYEQVVAETVQTRDETETNRREPVENDRDQRGVQGSNGDTDVKTVSISTGTNAEEVQ